MTIEIDQVDLKGQAADFGGLPCFVGKICHNDLERRGAVWFVKERPSEELYFRAGSVASLR